MADKAAENANLICEVRAGGGTYRDWLAIEVAYTCEEESSLRHVVLQTAEPSNSGVLKLKPGDRIDVSLAGQVVIREGYIKSRTSAYNANSHGVQIVALAKIGAVQETSIDSPNGGEFRNYDFGAIANYVLKPFGLSFRYSDPPAGAMERFPLVRQHQGETMWHFLSRLARLRGLILTTDADGNIIGGSPGGKTSAAVLEEGVNILSATAYIEDPTVDQIVSRSQTRGSDGMFGRTTSEIAAKAELGNGGNRKLIIVPDHPLNQQELQTATNMEAADLLRAACKVSVTHHGWFKPGTGALWELGDKATIKSPMLFPTNDGQLQMRVWAVRCLQSDATGTVSTVDFVTEPIFSRKYAQADSPNPFDQSAKEAVPFEDT